MIDEDGLDNLLLTWEECFEKGSDVSAEELCRELTKTLEYRINALKKIAWVKSTPVPGQSFKENVKLENRYRLEKVIGEGGFGQVWRGFDEELRRPVAIKVPKKRRQHADEDEAFLVEARKVAQLRHPGIVPVYDVGRHEGMYFIVSDLIDGQDLGAILRLNPPSVRKASRIVAEVARILDYAHQEGFIHRDIKPANILLDGHEKVFVTDFGIALTEAELRQADHNGCGTLAYMSPEQLHGDPSRIDASTDLYGLGVLLYQLLTKRLPFDADKPEELRRMILRQEPLSPRELRKGIPKEIERICLKCLSKSPANRPSTSGRLAEDLSHWLNRRKTNWLLVGAGMICCLFTGWLGIGRPFFSVDERTSLPLKEAALKAEPVGMSPQSNWTLYPQGKGGFGNGAEQYGHYGLGAAAADCNPRQRIRKARADLEMGHDNTVITVLAAADSNLRQRIRQARADLEMEQDNTVIKVLAAADCNPRQRIRKGGSSGKNGRSKAEGGNDPERKRRSLQTLAIFAPVAKIGVCPLCWGWIPLSESLRFDSRRPHPGCCRFRPASGS